MGNKIQTGSTIHDDTGDGIRGFVATPVDPENGVVIIAAWGPPEGPYLQKSAEASGL